MKNIKIKNSITLSNLAFWFSPSTTISTGQSIQPAVSRSNFGHNHFNRPNPTHLAKPYSAESMRPVVRCRPRASVAGRPLPSRRPPPRARRPPARPPAVRRPLNPSKQTKPPALPTSSSNRHGGDARHLLRVPLPGAVARRPGPPAPHLPRRPHRYPRLRPPRPPPPPPWRRRGRARR